MCPLCLAHRLVRAAELRSAGQPAAPRPPSARRRRRSGTSTSPTERPDARGDRRQRVEVEAVDRGRVAAEHRRHLVGGTPANAAAAARGERAARLLVRVVAAPHDLVDPDLVRAAAPRPADEARTRRGTAGRSTRSAAATARPSPAPHTCSCEPTAVRIREEVVEPASSSGIHAVPCSVNTSCSSGCRSSTPATDEVRRAHGATTTSPRAGTPPGPRGVAGRAALPPWWFTRHAELLAHRPQRLVVAARTAAAAGAGRHAGQQHAAGEPGRPPPSAPRRPRRRCRAAGSARCRPGGPGAAAQKSASQRLWARRPAQRRSRSPASAAGRLEHERRLREERRDRVREDDLGDDAVGLQLGEAAVASQLRPPSSPVESSYGMSYVAAHASNSSCSARRRYGR